MRVCRHARAARGRRACLSATPSDQLRAGLAAGGRRQTRPVEADILELAIAQTREQPDRATILKLAMDPGQNPRHQHGSLPPFTRWPTWLSTGTRDLGTFRCVMIAFSVSRKQRSAEGSRRLPSDLRRGRLLSGP